MTLIELKAHGPVEAKVLFPALGLVYLYFLLKGVRWLWIATIAVEALGLIPEVVSGSLNWLGGLLSLATLLLLLLPVTRRYFLGRTAAVSV